MIDVLARVLAYRFAIAFGDLPTAPFRRIPALPPPQYVRLDVAPRSDVAPRHRVWREE